MPFPISLQGYDQDVINVQITAMPKENTLSNNSKDKQKVTNVKYLIITAN